MAGALTDVQMAAALSEQVYRRANIDQQLLNNDIGEQILLIPQAVNAAVRWPTAAGYAVTDQQFYYDDNTGFVGQIVRANGKIFVVYRGTDMAGGLFDFVGAFVQDKIGVGWQSSTAIDAGDVASNVSLGFGTLNRSQADDALALYRLAAAVANITGEEVVVAGQSLGGGLAGIVSAVTGAKGYGFDPAPFEKQLLPEAEKLAVNFVLQTYSTSLLASFNMRTYAQQVSLLEGTDYIDTTVTAAQFLTVQSTYQFQKNSEYTRIYNNTHNLEAGPLFQTNTIIGEALTSGLVGAVVNSGAQAFPTNIPMLDIGTSSGSIGESIARHHPALINLVVRTQDSAQKFSELLARRPTKSMPWYDSYNKSKHDRIKRAITSVLFVAVGWVMIAYFPEVHAPLVPVPFTLLIAGGVWFTVGAFVYLFRWPDPWPKVFGYHEVFHVMIILGCACHFAAIAWVALSR